MLSYGGGKFHCRDVSGGSSRRNHPQQKRHHPGKQKCRANEGSDTRGTRHFTLPSEKSYDFVRWTFIDRQNLRNFRRRNKRKQGGLSRRTHHLPAPRAYSPPFPWGPVPLRLQPRDVRRPGPRHAHLRRGFYLAGGLDQPEPRHDQAHHDADDATEDHLGDLVQAVFDTDLD